MDRVYRGILMRRSTLLWVAILCLFAGPAVITVLNSRARSVQPMTLMAQPLPAPGPFDRKESAALFVGIRQFTSKPVIAEVRYAVDDAVDLAYTFAMDGDVNLVDPRKVVLALSGKPVKKDSELRLQQLKAAHATIVENPGQSDILALMQQQARAAGRNGILIVSFATHGFSSAGVPYVLSARSRFGSSETAVSSAEVLDIAASSPAARSLILFDTCRERVEKGRGSGPEPRAVAALLKAMAPVEGQVMFYAAAAGKYAYDDDKRHNGVFTAAILDGLQCRAEEDDRGFVTARTLSEYVEVRVRAWLQKNGHPSVRSAIQFNLDGGTSAMPLASCIPSPPPKSQPETAASDESRVDVFDKAGAHLWQRMVDAPIIHAEVADLDDDERNEVIVGTARDVIIFDMSGERISTTAIGPYELRSLKTADLFRKGTRQIVALATNDGGGNPSSVLSIFNDRGTELSSFAYPGRLKDVLIARRTSRHAPKLIVRASDADGISTLFMLNPKKVRTGSQLWRGILPRAAGAISDVSIVDGDHDGKQDIRVTTSEHHILFLDFDGRTLPNLGTRGDAHIDLLASKQEPATSHRQHRKDLVSRR
ncbi:MAG: caspase family protein [Acidobacteria bacterium]|nr:caspase family protein [Acidobacteriota bacterium]